jgi:hypothetical protein
MSYQVTKRVKGDIPGFFNALYNPSAKTGRTPIYSVEIGEGEYGWADFNRKGDAQVAVEWANKTGWTEELTPHLTLAEAFEEATPFKELPKGYLGMYGEASNWKYMWD